MRMILAVLAFLCAANANAAACFISEYSYIGRDGERRDVQSVQEPAVTTQAVTYTSSTQSAAFNAATTLIRVICDAKAHFVVSTNPTATANSPFIPADGEIYISLGAPGLEIAFYDGST